MFTPGCEFDHNHLSLGTLQRRSASESNMATAGQHGGRTPCLGGSPCSNMEDAFHYLRASEVALAAIWKMHSTTGEEIHRAQTPPYSEREYPIVVTTTLRAARRPE